MDVNEHAQDDSNLALNQEILRYASALAKANRSKITIIHAWHLYGEQYLKNWSRKDDLHIALLAEQEFEERKQQLEQLIQPYQNQVEFELQLIEGDARRVITEHVETQKPDLLIMGTVRRTGIVSFFIGNTAEDILDNISCNVLTLKPPSFTSPVK